eukprot:gene11506-13373_t
MTYMLSVAIIAFASLASVFGSAEHSDLDEILLGGVKDRVYPGAIGLVGNLDGILYTNPVGRHSYSHNDTTTKVNTLFDLASLTKVVSTTSAVSLMYQNGYLQLDTVISSVLGDKFNNGGKDNIIVLNCLLHNAGFAPDPVPWYWDPTFGCPNTDDVFPAQDFSCLNSMIYDSFLSETLVTPPGEAFVYSDLSFITLQMVVGTLVLEHKLVPATEMSTCLSLSSRRGTLNPDALAAFTAPQPQQIVCAFEAFVRTEVFHRAAPDASSHTDTNHKSHTQAWMPSTTYLPSESRWPTCMPTLNDTGAGSYTHKRLQGQVADGDCYAMGGIAGHAGVFSTAKDVATLARYLLSKAVEDTLSATDNATKKAAGAVNVELESSEQEIVPASRSTLTFLNATTVKLFSTVYNTSQSSRALGWSTNTPLAKDYGYDHSCGDMSAQTFMHTGYTGTCICIDPVNKLYSVVLTNRIYNCDGQLCPTGSSDPVKQIYKRFNSAAVKKFAPR